MNIRDLEYVVAVADLKNFTDAAARCFVSQPSLSGQIKKLEDQLGVKIFERSNKSVMVTDIGESIVQSARTILTEVSAMKDKAQRVQNPLGGRFNLGAFPTLSTYLFPKIVPNISKNLKDLKLVLTEDKTEVLIDKLLEGSLDAALLALPVDHAGLEVAPLFDDAFCLAVPKGHALSKKRKINQAELARHRLLLLEEGHCLRDQALDVCQIHNIGEEADFRATSLETLRLMVASGAGITFMPEIALRKGDRDIVYIPFAKPAPQRTIGLVWRKTTTKRPVIDQLKAICRA